MRPFTTRRRRRDFAGRADRVHRYYQTRQERYDRLAQRSEEYLRDRDARGVRISRRRREADRRFLRAVEEAQIRERNRAKRVERSLRSGMIPRRWRIGSLTILIALIIFLITEAVIPGSFLKRENASAAQKRQVELIPMEHLQQREAENATAEEEPGDTRPEQQIIWEVLMDYYGGNKTAVLGIMCNLNAESKLKAGTLEDYNNELWGIDDDTYTDQLNERLIDRKDFLESRHGGVTNGYFNKDQKWVNLDGGYGYAQFTAYDKKEELYRFADQWFSPGGRGEGRKFDISDPEMQANYLIRILESDRYSSMNYMIRHAEKVVDACYYWLKYYEVPYDPYHDDYFTLAFDRAESADRIERECTAAENAAASPEATSSTNATSTNATSTSTTSSTNATSSTSASSSAGTAQEEKTAP